MNLTTLQYNHKNDAMFCAPNSLYLQINSMFNSYIHDGIFHEIITLDDIARNIGFDKLSGSILNNKHLSKLSNRINKLNRQKKLNVPTFTLLFLDNIEFFNKLEDNKNQIFTICISFSQYYKFLKTKNNYPKYYKNAESFETDYIQHCFTLIVYYNDVIKNSKYIIIDPNIELTSQDIFINFNEIEQEYNDKIICVNSEDVKKLLTMRYDSLDDDRKIIDMQFESNLSLDVY